MVLLGAFRSSKHCTQIVTSRPLLAVTFQQYQRVCVLATLQQIGDKVENAMRLVCFSVQCFASQCWLGSVVDNSGRELWNSCPEECSLLHCTVTEQRRADGLSFYPRVM